MRALSSPPTLSSNPNPPGVLWYGLRLAVWLGPFSFVGVFMPFYATGVLLTEDGGNQLVRAAAVPVVSVVYLTVTSILLARRTPAARLGPALIWIWWASVAMATYAGATTTSNCARAAGSAVVWLAVSGALARWIYAHRLQEKSKP